LRGPFEERLNEMPHGGLTNGVSRSRRHVDVSEALFFVPNMPLALQDAQLSANRGIVRFARKAGHDFISGRAAQPVQNVHDLPVTAAESGMWFTCHSVMFITSRVEK